MKGDMRMKNRATGVAAGGRLEIERMAEEQVLLDLIGALLAENVCGMAETAVEVMLDEELFVRVDLEGERRYLLLPVRPGFTTRYIGRSADVVEVQAGEYGAGVSARLTPLQLLRRVGELAEAMGERLPGLEVFARDVETSLLHTRLSLEAVLERGGTDVDPFASFAAAERYAAYRDRPFHPIARVKGGFEAEEYRKYCAEYGGEVVLRWLAVRRDVVLAGGKAGKAAAKFTLSEVDDLRRLHADVASPAEPAELILSADERAQLWTVFEKAGLSRATYIALPVHPWQLERVVLKEFLPELGAGVFVPLEFAGGAFTATSSVRSLVPVADRLDHVKVPIGITSLGAMRFLPALYMLNGERGQQVLADAIRTDEVLERTLQLCDEGIWWAYFVPGSDLFEDRPRHVSALIRRFPAEEQLLPMSALCVYGLPNADDHLFNAWLARRGEMVTPAAVRNLFGEVCETFLHTALRLLRLGMLPELHGQNVVLVLKDDRVQGLLLRDHDTVRLHLPWLEAAGLQDPGYIVKPNRPNSLYNQTPEELVYYLQTLCIQVNLYAILDALVRTYGLAEEELWQELREKLESALSDVPFTAAQRTVIHRQLFETAEWPTKLLITPLLQQDGPAGGSMPAGIGQAVNPFRQLVAAQ
ncbi:siderophore synthetase component [Tumebacillus sp. BK434]|nr:siderophore synthetase component [Tumebacillus sp. BK434]